jgi:hypothetical protein
MLTVKIEKPIHTCNFTRYITPVYRRYHLVLQLNSVLYGA